MTAQRILLINDDGTAEVGGVKVRVVPVEPTEAMCNACTRVLEAEDYPQAHRLVLSAAAIDLSGLPRVPERKPLGDDDKYGERYLRAWGWNQALDAVGVPK